MEGGTLGYPLLTYTDPYTGPKGLGTGPGPSLQSPYFGVILYIEGVVTSQTTPKWTVDPAWGFRGFGGI